jgi:hypothetical protein
MNEENREGPSGGTEKDNQAVITRDPNTSIVECKNRVANFLLQKFVHNQNKWLSVDELARQFYGRATEDNRRKMRHAITTAGRFLLRRQFFLLKAFAKKDCCGEIREVKIFDSNDANDHGHARYLLERLEQRGELSEQQLKAIENIIGDDSCH